MKIKRIFIVLGIATFVFVFYGVYRLYKFNIFNDEFRVIQEIKIPNKRYLIRIYYIPPNASSQSYIQVRKFENDTEKVLQSYERFNYLNNYELLHQDILKLSISDTSQAGLIKEIKLKL